MLSPITTEVSPDNRELVEHGTKAFPVGCYHDDLIKEGVPWHWHEELEAAVVTEGESLVTIGSEAFIAAKGEGFFVNSGVLHSCVAKDSASCRFHSLVFHSRLVGSSLDSVYYQKYVLPVLRAKNLLGMRLVPDGDWQEEALGNIESAWESIVNETEDFEIKARHELSRFLALLSRHLPVNPGKSPWDKKDEERIKKMLQFIGEEYAEDLRTEDIAASAAVSESECLRCFKKTIGKTPIQFLKEYRLERASELLLSSSSSVGDIAYSTGFQDVSYFIKSFKALKGCTPKVFREESELT